MTTLTRLHEPTKAAPESLKITEEITTESTTLTRLEELTKAVPESHNITGEITRRSDPHIIP